MSDQMKDLSAVPVCRAEVAATESDGVRHDRIEHGLNIRRRARDDPQNLAGRRLLLKGLSHLRVGGRKRTILLLQLLEQPDVLNGNDRLVGEGLQERDL